MFDKESLDALSDGGFGNGLLQTQQLAKTFATDQH